MEEPAMAVVISTLDRPDRLRRCLAALAAGSTQPTEVVVVDQSVQATALPVVTAAAAAGLPARHHFQARKGLSASQNLGFASVTAPFVAVVDDDCVPDVEWLSAARERLTAADRPELVTGPVLPLPPEGNRTVAVSTRAGTEDRVF